MTAKLLANELTLIRGDRCLFADLSFALSPGELMLLEGRNGSGKTSLLRAMVGMLELESGDVTWEGTSLSRDRHAFNASLVWLGHRAGFKSDLTVAENLRFESALRVASGGTLEDALERLGILRLKNLAFRLLSAGQQRRVAIARMLLSGAELWLMDEPFTNLDRDGRQLIMDIVGEQLAAGGLCVMTAHQDVDIDAPTTRVTL